MAGLCGSLQLSCAPGCHLRGSCDVPIIQKHDFWKLMGGHRALKRSWDPGAWALPEKVTIAQFCPCVIRRPFWTCLSRHRSGPVDLHEAESTGLQVLRHFLLRWSVGMSTNKTNRASVVFYRRPCKMTCPCETRDRVPSNW